MIPLRSNRLYYIVKGSLYNFSWYHFQEEILRRKIENGGWVCLVKKIWKIAWKKGPLWQHLGRQISFPVSAVSSLPLGTRLPLYQSQLSSLSRSSLHIKVRAQNVHFFRTKNVCRVFKKLFLSARNIKIRIFELFCSFFSFFFFEKNEASGRV